MRSRAIVTAIVGGALTVSVLVSSCRGADPDGSNGSGQVSQPDCSTIWQRAGSGFYEDNPVYTDDRGDSGEWTSASPASVGMDGALLDAGAEHLAQTGSLRSIIVLRHGTLVHEGYVNGGAADQALNIHSVSKSILQALVGIAIEEGHIDGLDDRASTYLPSSSFEDADPATKRITIGQLLTMSSGLAWTEDHTESWVENQPDWVSAILSRPLVETPGSTFNYSTGNTHVLSAVLENATGMSTCEYATTRLFGPLGITAEHWGQDPQAVSSSGYNLYLRPREMARFGQLYLDSGRWKGEQVVPTRTVAEAHTTSFRVDGDVSYSSGWWQRSIAGYEMFFGWGFGGQFLYVIPDLDLVFAATADTAPDTDDAEIDSGHYISTYLIPAVRND